MSLHLKYNSLSPTLIPNHRPVERLHAWETETSGRLDRLERELASLRKADQVSILCFSGGWDRMYAALSIATGAMALGRDVHLYFSFWSVGTLLNRQNPQRKLTMTQKFIRRAFTLLSTRVSLPGMGMFGIGKESAQRYLKRSGMEDIDSLMAEAVELGVQLHVCETTLGMIGLKEDELLHHDQIDCCGVSTFLAKAFQSQVTLFV